MQVKKQARQGDIYFTRVDNVPEKTTVVEDGVIARGEVTGHTHQLINKATAVLNAAVIANQLLKTEDNKLFVYARQPAQIGHEEHTEIILEPGYWEVTRQREYTPQGLRQVAD